MTDRTEALAITLFSEMFMADQLARAALTRALPKGMELSHFSVLNHMASAGGDRTPAQLAKIFYVTRGAMTNTLGKLEWAGYVHISPDWEDARRKLVVISPAGRSARNAALAALTPILNEVVSDIGPDRVKAVIPVLREVRNQFERRLSED
jgi:DNA-binding MarR family transcriptional regulator